MAISDVQDSESWHYILDSSGKKTATLAKSSTGTSMGIGMDFIVVRNGSWYYTYVEKGKKIATMAVSSTGEFKNAAGTSINFVNGSWIYTYDKNGKKLAHDQIIKKFAWGKYAPSNKFLGVLK